MGCAEGAKVLRGGEMYWIRREDLTHVPVVDDFEGLLQVMPDDALNEFRYVIEGDVWRAVLK